MFVQQNDHSRRNLQKRRIKETSNSYVKRKLMSRAAVGPLKSNGKVINGNMDMATLLNKYFVSVFNKDDIFWGETLLDIDIRVVY